ncbi:hypothetical protein BELL_0608g00050 [Botrytis elliptica]|uniref:Major facilitator superfamily (MFS) profile domain-containing protein n=1 Tax=Botrytis elliptica TaxID=278938 RepID=A0A4Z1JC97_9HELO|nr:hypothetical protein BELL_0608g00050 [Botrytis elliptica]
MNTPQQAKESNTASSELAYAKELKMLALQVEPQAELYNKTTTQIAYQNSAGSAAQNRKTPFLIAISPIGIFFVLFNRPYLSDRPPLSIAKKYNNGFWVPEYRLHALWFPDILNPIRLGLFGAGLLYHLHWVILALATVLVTFGSLCITPITINYINECFIDNLAEASIAVNFYRVGFGLSVAFCIKPWVADVNVRWTYGMMAFRGRESAVYCVVGVKGT